MLTKRIVVESVLKFLTPQDGKEFIVNCANEDVGILSRPEAELLIDLYQLKEW